MNFSKNPNEKFDIDYKKEYLNFQSDSSQSPRSTFNSNSTTNSKKKSRRKIDRIVAVLIFLTIVVILQELLRSYIKKINIFFGIRSLASCQYLNYFEFFDIGGRYFLLFTIYNMVNAYAALCFIFLDAFSVFVNGLIRFIYLDPRPFWQHDELPPCFCATDYGDPSTTGTNLVIIFLTFYKCFMVEEEKIERSEMLKKKINNYMIYNNTDTSYDSLSNLNPRCSVKRVCLILLGFSIVLYTSAIRILQNIHYAHQLLFGYCIGYAIYYIFFYIIEVNIESESQFSYLMNNKFKVTIIVIIVYFFSNILHIELDRMGKLDLDQAEFDSYMVRINKYCTLSNLFKFANESYSKSTRLWEFLGYYWGLGLEYKFIFKNEFERFYMYNVKSENHMFKGLSSDKNFKTLKTILRIFIMYMFYMLLLEKSIMTKQMENNEHSILYCIVIGLIIPYICQGIINFFILKKLLVYMKLTNEIVNENTDENYTKQHGYKPLEGSLEYKTLHTPKILITGHNTNEDVNLS